MLEYDIDIAFTRDIPDRLAEASRFLGPGVELRRVHGRHLTPAVELLAIDHPFSAKIEDILGPRLIRYDCDRVGARRGHKLYAEYAETARTTPHQHIVT